MRLGVRDVAHLFGVSEKTVYRWVAQDKLPVYKMSGQHRFNRSELLDWATSHRIAVSPQILVESDDEELPVPTLSEALGSGGIFYRVGGKDKASVLARVVAVMPLPDEVDRKFLHEVLLARETLGSTAIGGGIAIPHARNPIVLHIAKPAVTLCFLDEPVEYGALDGKPVDILFTIVSPTVKAHLSLLSRLAFGLQDPEFSKAILEKGMREAILDQAKCLEERLSLSTSK